MYYFTDEKRNERLEQLRLLGAKNGFELLSAVYGWNVKMVWKNKNGDIIERSPRYIKMHGWTVQAKVAKGRKMTSEEHLQELSDIAKSKGGKLISTKYINCHTKLEFEDSCGYTFFARPHKIKNGEWSPFISSSEELCRQVFEFIFNTSFKQNWNIIKIEKRKFQLDGFNNNVIINKNSYQIGFEYQGWKSHRDDEKTINRDNLKKQYCENNGIILFIIEKLESEIRYDSEKLFNYIKNIIYTKLLEENILFNIPYNNDFKINFERLYKNKKILYDLKQFGLENGYELLSTEYVDCKKKLKWKRISDGLEFDRSPTYIKSYGWLFF